MRICLIDPPGVMLGLNVGLGYLASSLMARGHQVKVLDLNNNRENLPHRLEEVRGYDIVGISIKSFTARSSLEIAKGLDAKHLVCGGPHIALDGYNFLVHNPNFDAAVLGEGELALAELAEAWEGQRDLRELAGIAYRSGDRVEVTQSKALKEDLDSLPFPNYEVFDSFTGAIPLYPLITSRGCPYPCIYCSVGKVSGKRWRSQTPAAVVEELKWAKTKYNSKKFSVLDDNFTLNMPRAKELCRLLILEHIGMEWGAPNGIRADRLDEELAALMKESGCLEVSLGIESLDEGVFNNIKKGERLEDVKRAIGLLTANKIKVGGFFIIGLPGDTLEKTKSSLRLARNLGLTRASWGLLVPYPGTEVWDWAGREARIIRNWEEGFHFHPGVPPSSVFETKDYSEKDRIHAYNLANIRCQAYRLFWDDYRSPLYNSVKILRMILAYDFRGITGHLLYFLRNLKRIGNFVRRRR